MGKGPDHPTSQCPGSGRHLSNKVKNEACILHGTQHRSFRNKIRATELFLGKCMSTRWPPVSSINNSIFCEP